MRFLLLTASLACLTAYGIGTAAEPPGYLVRVVGRVMSVDARSGRIVLHHGMLETANPADVPCLVPSRHLRFIRSGMEISALADTRHRPWKLVELHQFRETAPARPATGPVRLALEIPSEF